MTHDSMSAVLGRIPSGIFILTARHGQDETGMLASWVMQAGFEPPMVSVAVRRDRYLAEWLLTDSPFVLNLVAQGHKPLLSHFGRGFEPGQPAFEGLSITRSSHGVPVLSDIIGHLECEPAGHVDTGDHRIFVARVTGGALAADEPPMVHIRKTGMKY
jgi:flavin reductase (DIM6/NTAB) family NADH-FMN oxidoreductase RutF